MNPVDEPLHPSESLASGHAPADNDLLHPFGFELIEEEWLARLRNLRLWSSTDGSGSIGPYEVLAVIGRGGQGVVYKVRQPGTGRVIAIKRISAGDFATPQMQARFRREAEAASSLEHPGIVTIFQSEVINGQPVLAMQWVDGVPFDQWAQGQTGTRRSPMEILSVFLRLCDAVHHAHQRGVIHRDLKPSNILIDGDNQPHVLDFGLAKLDTPAASDPSLTLTGDFIGTPIYAAPEQVRGRQVEIDVRTDVYALGAVLYQALTGQTLFPSVAGLAETLEAIQSTEPRPPSALRPGLNREIDAIVLKAVAKDKNQRYRSVDSLGADIQRLLTGQAVLAHPPSTSYRLRKFVRQHRGAVGLGAALVLFLILSLAVSIGAYLRAERQRKLTQQALAAESEQRARAEREEARAQQETERAQREAAKHAAVGSLITDIFQMADPGGQGGRSDVTVREALDAAGAQLSSKDVHHDPEVEASIRFAMAKIYESLSLEASAAEHYQRALTLRRQVFGDEHETVASTLNDLARIYRSSSRPLAEALQREVLDIRRRLLPRDSPYLAQVLSSLGITLRHRGDYRGAEQLYREAREIYRVALGEDNENVALLSSSICILLTYQGRNTDAIQEGRRAEAIFRRMEGNPCRSGLITLLTNLAAAHWRNGDRARAEAMIREALGINRGCYPDPHGITARLLQILGEWLIQVNRFDDAEPLLLAGRDACRRLDEQRPSETHANTQWALALVARHGGRLEEAETEGLLALQMHRERRSGTAEGIAVWLSEVRLERGDFAGAEDILKEVLSTTPLAQRPAGFDAHVARRLFELYEAWEATERADRWRDR